MIFQDRVTAGKLLALDLSRYKGRAVVVFALPRGGVVLGAEVARYLNAPLDLLIPRKIGHPKSQEYAIGAVTETGQPVWNNSELGSIDETWRSHQVHLARREAKRRRVKYQRNQRLPDLAGQTAIIVDDGIATGLTMIAAVRDLIKLQPESVVVAVPVAPGDVIRIIAKYVDDVIVLHHPRGHFGAIGAFYKDFPQVGDEEVRGLMDAYRTVPITEPLDLMALNALLATIQHYPVTSTEIAAQAKRLHSPANVVNFFESIPGNVEFEDKTDVMLRSEEAAIVMEDERGEPDERLRSYDS